MKFYPKHKTAIKFSNKDLKYKHNNKPYTGYYLATSDGKFYAGRNNMNLGRRLVLSRVKSKHKKKFGVQNLVKKFNFFKTPIESAMGNYMPLPVSKPRPTISDYGQSYYRRYFVQRINGSNYIEIDSETFNSLKSQNGNYDHNLYKMGSLRWKITGDKVFEINAREIKNKSRRFPNLHYAFPILNEYAKISPTVIENLHTAGGDLYYADGTEYVGAYHIHPVQGPMVGATHSPEPHDNLYYFHQLPSFGGVNYQDWLNNYNTLTCYKCIQILDTLQIVAVQRSRLLGCLEGSYTTETEAAESCPRIAPPEDPDDGNVPFAGRPNPPLEGGINSPTWVNDAIGGDSWYSGFDSTDTIEDEIDTIIEGSDEPIGDGLHPPYGYGGSSGGGVGGGNSFGPSCFIPNTLITMADGTEKPISSIEIGDIVKSEKGESTVLNIQIHEGEFSVYSLNKGKPFVTAEHPFKTIDGWKAIDPVTTFERHQIKSTVLNLNDIIYKLEGKEVIENIEKGFTTYPKVYNLSLDNEHVFYANGYLVHNLKTVDVRGNEGGGGGSWDIDDWFDTYGLGSGF